MKTAVSLLISIILMGGIAMAQGDEEWVRESVVERLVRYAKIDTQSKEDVDEFPSTQKQFDLARMLFKEMQDLGLQDVRLDEKRCYVYATVSSNLAAEEAEGIPAIGFIAHMDTSSAVNATNVQPVIHRNYQGGDIVLPGDPKQVITVKHNPDLLDHIGSDIVTSDGTSLLGGDDKAGIAEILTAVEYLLKHPEIKRGNLKIAFTPDEEVGKGTQYFDIDQFGARYAYTIDGGRLGEIGDETFNAKAAIVTFTGKNTHPGYAKNIMVNSMYAAAHFLSLFSEVARPETTEKREGYLHPYDLVGNEEQTRLKILLRDFEKPGMELKAERLEEMVAVTRAKFPKTSIKMEIRDSYSNMNEILRLHPEVSLFAEQAVKQAGVKPVKKPVRGGTDGSRLSFMGLPTPNLFTGNRNPHSKIEWVSADAMVKSVKTIVNLARIWAEKQSAVGSQ